MLRRIVRFIYNFIWKITGGILFAVFWCILGVIFFVSIFGINFSRQCFRLAYFALKPFGKEIVILSDDRNLYSFLWIFTGGIIVAIWCIFYILTLTLTIVGVPLAYQCVKVGIASMFPFEVVIM